MLILEKIRRQQKSMPNYPARKELKNTHLPFLHTVNFLSICQDLNPQPETNQIQCHIYMARVHTGKYE